MLSFFFSHKSLKSLILDCQEHDVTILNLLQSFNSLIGIRIEIGKCKSRQFNKGRQKKAKEAKWHGLLSSGPISAFDSSVVLFKTTNNLPC